MVSKQEGTSLLFLLCLLPQFGKGAPLSQVGPSLSGDHSSLPFCLPCLILHPVLIFLGILFLAKNLYVIPRVSFSSWEATWQQVPTSN